MAGKEWVVHRIVGCDPYTMRSTLPTGLKGVPEDTLSEASTVLLVRVPEWPHVLHDKYMAWCKVQGITDAFVEKKYS